MSLFVLLRSPGLTCPCLSCHEMSSFSPMSVALCSHSVRLGVGDEGGFILPKSKKNKF